MQMESKMTSNSMSMGMMEMSMAPMTMMSGDKGPLMLMGKWMPSMKTMVMSYGGYLKDSKKKRYSYASTKTPYKYG